MLTEERIQYTLKAMLFDQEKYVPEGKEG